MSHALRTLAAFALCFALPSTATAQGGGLDPSFGEDGVALPRLEGTIGGQFDGRALAVDDKDRPTLGGSRVGSPRRPFAARLTPAGYPDDPFGGDGFALLPEIEDVRNTFYGVAADLNERVVAAGSSWRVVGGSSRYHILLTRHLADGTLDASFGAGGIATFPPGLDGYPDAYATSVARHLDGYVASVRLFDRFVADTEVCAVYRFRDDGTLDPAFGDNGRALLVTDGPCDAEAVAASGSTVYLAGTVVLGDGENGHDGLIAALDASGQPLAHFGSAGQVVRDFDGFDEFLLSLDVAPDGSLLAAGLGVKGDRRGVLVLRYTAAGEPLATFGSDGLFWAAAIPGRPDTNLWPGGAVALADGGVAFAATDTGRIVVGRLGADGLYDTTFGTGGVLSIETPDGRYRQALAAKLDTKGRLVVLASQNADDPTEQIVLVRVLLPVPVSADAQPTARAELHTMPNPTSADLAVTLSLATPGDAHVSVYDALGRRVATLHDGPVAGELRARWDARRVAPGAYVVVARVGDAVTTRRVSVVR